jgi:membrane protease YdiL (CAAX protease family)
VTARRTPTIDPADALRAGIPALLLLAALVQPPVAGIVLVVLVIGVAVAATRSAPVTWSWAAMVPAAGIAALRAFGAVDEAWSAPRCDALATPLVSWTIAEALLVLAGVAVLALALRAKASDVAIRWPARYAVRWAVWGAVLIVVAGLAGMFLLVGRLWGGPGVRTDGVTFVVPAIVFAVALAVSEELAWRGALQGWLARTLGGWPAAVVQGAGYGVAWGAAMGSPLVGALAAAAGLALGAVVIRTRSLLVPLAWHVAFNVPLWVSIACRPG